ncbi:ribosomal small subunit protein bTHX [Sphingobacterium allocomposti]|uniref:Ribosomal small subunit protein bTHX n=1 Tax=Sphingobacterium allocomposti TaxID=415956 RepID=A0A5S5D8U8_9SPHI|nr:30S ribosomal protein THX [Sphingobacterium composti Yoo et al. 2007 non Ten et al. 2007]TYP92503.1 ribosomal small subunit protein bTHX [Sphingobacterium composti Yoo et al. 2007 non Ten et al. 2007]
MGKGDKKTKRGKIIMGSFGKKRPKKRGPKITRKKEEGAV